MTDALDELNAEEAKLWSEIQTQHATIARAKEPAAALAAEESKLAEMETELAEIHQLQRQSGGGQ